MPNTNPLLTPRMVADFCRKRLVPLLHRDEVARLENYLTDLLDSATLPPMIRDRQDWREIAAGAGIEYTTLRPVARSVQPILDAIARAVMQLHSATEKPRVMRGRRAIDAEQPSRAEQSQSPGDRPASAREDVRHRTAAPVSGARGQNAKKKTGYPPREIVEFPDALWSDWTDPVTFPAALALHMERHGDTAWHLYRAIVREGDDLDRKTIVTWRDGTRSPRSAQSLEILARIERRYRLPRGYFKVKFLHKARAVTGQRAAGILPAELRRLAWHLPDDFNDRSSAEQEEILNWVRSTVISGTTDYRRYQAAAMRQRYAVRFPSLLPRGKRKYRIDRTMFVESDDDRDETDPELISGVVDAPPELVREMKELMAFKTATLAAYGFQRNGVWGDETAAQKLEHLGLMFGALTAGAKSAVKGRGVPLRSLSFGMLVFPAVWDWYVQWREQRRGFYTAWEVDMMRAAAALTRADTGWLRQCPHLIDRVEAIPGLVSDADVSRARSNWADACETMHKHALGRAKEIARVARVHRDPFDPILSASRLRRPARTGCGPSFPRAEDTSRPALRGRSLRT